MESHQINKYYLLKKIIFSNETGYSLNQLVITISIIGILAGTLLPNFRPAVEFVEVLIAEKYLLSAYKECQIGLINNEIIPLYFLPEKNINLGVFRDKRFIFSHTGIKGECAPELGGNYLRASRVNSNNGNLIYSLIINVKTGEKISEGSLPSWLDWWDSKSLSLISEDEIFSD